MGIFCHNVAEAVYTEDSAENWMSITVVKAATHMCVVNRTERRGVPNRTFRAYLSSIMDQIFTENEQRLPGKKNKNHKKSS